MKSDATSPLKTGDKAQTIKNAKWASTPNVNPASKARWPVVANLMSHHNRMAANGNRANRSRKSSGDSAVHRDEEFLIGIGSAHAVFQELHGFNGVHVRQVLSQHPDALQHLLVHQEIFSART